MVDSAIQVVYGLAFTCDPLNSTIKNYFSSALVAMADDLWRESHLQNRGL